MAKTRPMPPRERLERALAPFRGTRVAKAVLSTVTADPTPPIVRTLARFREAGLLTPSRKGARTP